MQSLGDVDETSIDIPLSSILTNQENTTSQFYDDDDPTEGGGFSEEDNDEEEKQDLPEDDAIVLQGSSLKHGSSKENHSSNERSHGDEFLKDTQPRRTGTTRLTESPLLSNNHQPVLKSGTQLEDDTDSQHISQEEDSHIDQVVSGSQRSVSGQEGAGVVGSSKQPQRTGSFQRHKGKEDIKSNDWSDFDDESEKEDEEEEEVENINNLTTTLIKDDAPPAVNNITNTSQQRIDGTYSMDSLDDNTESSSILGAPRRRPRSAKKQESLEEEVIMEMKETVNYEEPLQSIAGKQQQQQQQHQETEFVTTSPRHRPSPILYPKSPRALKNLNASPSKDSSLVRQHSTTSKGSSTVCASFIW